MKSLESRNALMGKDDESLLILGKDLKNPALYKAYTEARKLRHQPFPPGNEIGQAGHHWLRENRQLSGSADAGSWIVAQWSPTELRWYHSNELATTAKPMGGDGLMTDWEWKGCIPLPDIE